MPPQHVDAGSETGYYDDSQAVKERAQQSFTSSFESNRNRPKSAGWSRYQDNKAQSYGGGFRKGPKQIEGRAIRRTTQAPKKAASAFKVGERVFHQKFGYGSISMADGNKLTVEFEKAGEKKVLDGFVEKA